MEAVLISPFLILFIALLSAVLGWFLKKRTEGTWQEDFLVLEKEHNTLSKKAKKLTKDNARFKKQIDSWKEKVRFVEEQYKTEKEQWKQEATQTKSTLQAKDQTIRQLESANQNLKTDFERLKTTHTKLNTKYKEDLVSLKEWRKNKDGFNRKVKDLNGRLIQSKDKITQLTNANAKLSKELAENSTFVSKLRALKARNAKLQEDLTYWEKKHYDCHHELATLKTQFETIQESHEQLKLQNQSALQTQSHMQQKVQEFKTKFVNINDKYHRLLESKN